MFLKTVFMALLLAPAAAGLAAEEGEAKGELAVAAKTTPLAHAYAVPRRDGETLLLLTDEPLSDRTSVKLKLEQGQWKVSS